MRTLGLALVALLILVALGSGISSLLGVEAVAETFERLSLPPSLMTLTGTCKVLGAVGLVVTALRPLPTLREWVFAGFTFHFAGASFLHLASGDTLGQTAPVLVLLGLTLAAWRTSRPEVA